MKNCESLLAYSTVAAAVHGDAEAIQRVLKYYERYISTLATRTMFDTFGATGSHYCSECNGVCKNNH